MQILVSSDHSFFVTIFLFHVWIKLLFITQTCWSHFSHAVHRSSRTVSVEIQRVRWIMRAVDNHPLLRWTSSENVIHKARLRTRYWGFPLSPPAHYIFPPISLKDIFGDRLDFKHFSFLPPFGDGVRRHEETLANPTSWLITTRGQRWAFCLRDRGSLQGHSCIQTCINKSLVTVRKTETLSYHTVCSSTLLNRL